MFDVAAAVPQPPLLVPELAGTAAGPSQPLRRACRQVARRLADRAARWIVVGVSDPPDPRSRTNGGDGPVRIGGAAGDDPDHDAGGWSTNGSTRRAVGPWTDPRTTASFVGFAGPVGADVRVDLGGRDGTGDPGSPVRADLPLALLIAGWLAGQVRDPHHPVRIDGLTVPAELPAAGCRELGRELAGVAAATSGPVALLVVGDGAICHTERAPGHFDPRAAGFDAAVAAALAAGDTAALADLDPDVAADLGAVGRVPWQVLAAAVTAPPPDRSAAAPPDRLGTPPPESGWSAELLYSDVPFGVGYHVALWTPPTAPTRRPTVSDPARPNRWNR